MTCWTIKIEIPSMPVEVSDSTLETAEVFQYISDNSGAPKNQDLLRLPNGRVFVAKYLHPYKWAPVVKYWLRTE